MVVDYVNSRKEKIFKKKEQIANRQSTKDKLSKALLELQERNVAHQLQLQECKSSHQLELERLESEIAMWKDIATTSTQPTINPSAMNSFNRKYKATDSCEKYDGTTGEETWRSSLEKDGPHHKKRKATANMIQPPIRKSTRTPVPSLKVTKK